ncbi:cytochrome c oxidase copper chaperone 2 isoform X1 [Arachis hypogaea]|uniref:cytochrome c oxidase copper chaperone 2 isoform X1 n=2 Tax=Arachis TaxID=3817 RepID=UPI000DECC333|nr:cytochrome c oxidase copper chaperone 2 isoform X1 [Arachis hypogaea]XP_025643945.1 cytochrome c oxidase copper chaperone 2 isoform X1 [Arachis hypogaea]
MVIYFDLGQFKIMSGMQLQSASSTLSTQGSKQNEGVVAAATVTESKPKKKICCACPDAKKLRDECIVEHGEASCAKWIEAHKQCLRSEGFNV